MAYQKQHPQTVKLQPWRRRLLLLLLLAGFFALAVRSLYLQSLHKDFLQEKGEERYSRSLALSAHRGKILDRNGELLAISMPVESVWASPADVKMSINQRKQLAGLLGVKTEVIDKKISQQDKEFIYLKRRMEPELANRVMALDIPGVFLQREFKRYYPAGQVAAHVVGMTDVNDRGQEGIERAIDAELSGEPGSRRVLKDRKGRIVDDLEAVKVPVDGRDVMLSIDRRLQHLVHRELNKAVTQHHAKAGAAVLLDAKTGEVLAMVNVPTYNPNNPVNVVGKTRNRVITDIFEPGSTMKPISVAAAMQQGDFTPETKIQTGSGQMSIGPATIHDTHAYGVLTVAQVIQKSSNVGASKMALSLKREALWNTFRQIGFGAQAGIGFPAEAAGKLRNYTTWRPIEQATMSYGHGISLTLLQLARAYTVFANEGELKKITLFKRSEPATQGTAVFSAKVANDMKDMLELVVKPGGTATRAQVAGYRVGGKTGTAHKLGASGYEKDKYVGSFVGLAPASNPRLIFAVMIDEPSIEKDQYYGGIVAAPVFSAAMADALRLLAVPHDMESGNVVIEPNSAELEPTTEGALM